MKRALTFLRIVTLALLVMPIAAGVASAATKIGAIGTTQLAGEWAAFNKPYSLGNKGAKMNFTLKSVEYRADQVILGNDALVPKPGEKLMVIRYTIHNPEKREQGALWNTFKFTAVDSEDANHDYINQIGQQNNQKVLNMSLKPAQKVEAYTIVRVGANGEVPKLMVSRGSGMILRYDLRGKATKLPQPYADPADTTGATLLPIINGKIGDYYQARDIDFKVDSFEVKTGDFGDIKPGKNKESIIVYVTAKNKAPKQVSLLWHAIKPEMALDSGSAAWKSSLHDAKNVMSMSNMPLQPGQETKLAYVFIVNPNTQPQTVTFDNGSGLKYTFNLAQ